MNSIENGRKIAFVGTSCIGKTFLFEYYQGRYQGDPLVSFVEEAAREYFKKNSGIPVDKRFGLGPQGEIQDLAIQKEKAAHESGAEIIFCDRSVLDAVAYVRGYGDKEGSNELFERIRFWLPTYHSILLLNPADVSYETDSERLESPETRNRNHDAFLEVFMQENIPYNLLSGTKEQRIQRVDEILLLS